MKKTDDSGLRDRLSLKRERVRTLRAQSSIRAGERIDPSCRGLTCPDSCLTSKLPTV